MTVQNAIITGARSGIGLATLKLFAKNGINIWACLRKPDIEFNEISADLMNRFNIWIKPVYFDMANDDEIKQAMKLIISDRQPINILVNNAGIPHGGFLQMTPISTFHDVFQINFFSQILIMQTISRIMSRQKTGSIINITSVAGLDADKGYSAYGSSKAALTFVTKTLSKELAANGIRVNAIAPGLVKTHMMDMMEAEAKSSMISNSAMGRFGYPEEIAEAIFYLASDKASFVTGQIFRVDGGL